MSSSAVGTIADELSQTLEKTATDALDAAMERADEAGVDADRTTLEGFPHEAIVKYGDDHEVDCIVMGARPLGAHGEVARQYDRPRDQIGRPLGARGERIAPSDRVAAVAPAVGNGHCPEHPRFAER